jgi:hypothetical protein
VTACGSGKPRKCPKLSDPKPMMPITRNYRGVGMTGNRKQHKIAPALRSRVRHRQRQRAATANQRKRAALTNGCGVVHAS